MFIFKVPCFQPQIINMSAKNAVTVNDSCASMKFELPENTPEWAHIFCNMILTINTSLEKKIGMIENEVTLDLKVAKDIADKDLSIVNLCKHEIDDLSTKYDSLYEANSESLKIDLYKI